MLDYKDQLKDQLKNHELRIRKLEENSIRVTERLDSLCNRLGRLTTSLWALVTIIITALIGFLIWYIQSLPR